MSSEKGREEERDGCEESEEVRVARGNKGRVQ